MTRNVFAACILTLAFASIGNAQGAASSPETTHYTQAQVKQLERNANAPDQWKIVASYYEERQKSYLQLAAAEKKEWEQRSQNVTGAFAKYPRPSDSARNLYEYYMEKASKAGELDAKYSRLAGLDPPVNAQ